MIKASRVVLSLIVSFIYSLAYAVVGPMAASQDFGLHKSFILSFAVCFLVCFIVNYILFTFVPRIRFDKADARISGFFERFKPRTLFLCTWLFIFLCWVPALLVTFPGVLSYDIISQSGDAISGISSNHHPVLHTWLLSVFMKFGKAVFGTYESGLGFLSLLQMVVLSYAFTRFIFTLKKKKVSSLLLLIVTLFFALWFTNAVMAVTMVKDTLHAAFFVLFVCHFTEIVTSASEYFGSLRNRVLLPIVAFFMLATRNNGLHIYLFCFAILFLLKIVGVIRSGKVKKCVVPALVVLIPVVVFKLYSGPFFARLGIVQGDIKEAFCVPIQQLQRVDVINCAELTPEEKATLESYIVDAPQWMGYDRQRAYDPFSADPAKGWFYTYQYDQSPKAFWKFYIKMGLKFPRTYIEAFLSNTLDFWYPGHYLWSYVMYDDYPAEDFALFTEPLTRRSLVMIKPVDDYYRSLCLSESWRNIPVVRFFFVPGFSAWMLLYMLIFSWRKKGFFTKALPLYLPHIAQFGIMLLCPIASFRYSWPLFLTVPVAFIMIFEKGKENELTNSAE
ncbi:MAG: hypothetical protein IKR39_08405 [Lachnospiraceae bacterium]|nr:hypothetical protein [Lachnospiraceae bacterium]